VYLWNRKLERCALHNYTQATERGPINRFFLHASFRLLGYTFQLSFLFSTPVVWFTSW